MLDSEQDQQSQQQVWLNDARANRVGALASLLESYREKLLAKTRKRIGKYYLPGKSGSDVVQTVITKALNHFDQFNGTTCAEFEAWLHRILMNCLADTIKKAGTKVPTHHTTQAKEQADMHPSPSSQSRRNESANQLRRLIAQMPEPYRSVVILRYIEGIESFADIATTLGRKEGTVRQQWLRGLKWLKEVEGMEEIE